jgi:AraC family transcriptional regulator
VVRVRAAFGEGEHTSVRVAYRHIRPATVVYTRTTGGYKVAAKGAWERLNGWLAEHQVRRQVKRAFGLFHDNPHVTPPELLRYDACAELMTGLDADPAAGIGRQMLSGGTYAVHTHIGGYDPMGGLFSELHRDWVPKQGFAVDYDRCFMAIHLNDPLVTREMHRRTELCIPVLPLSVSLPAESTGADEGFVSPLMRLAVGLG